jgi:precorrin-3B synthase
MMRFEYPRTAVDLRPALSGPAPAAARVASIEAEVQVQTAVDACPGMLTLHPARDGDVARLRLPGGYITGPQWTAIAALACEFGDGNVDITARGNVQVRGVHRESAAELASRAAGAGLLPSDAHDRARNITASPLAGLGDHPPLRGMVEALDAAIVTDPELAALPGRFLFAVDDGTGGAALARSDVGLRCDGREAELFIAGRSAGLRVAAGEAVPAAVRAARAAVALGVGTACARIRELPGTGSAVAEALGGGVGPAAPPDDGRLPLRALSLSGHDVLVAGARLGRLTAAQVMLTGSLLHQDDVLRLAAAGRIVLPLSVAPDAAAGRLAGAGLLTTEDDTMSGVSACSGMACSRSVADVRALARPLPGRPRTHWAGCARGCGAPADADLIVAAGADSFLIGGEPADIANTGVA